MTNSNRPCSIINNDDKLKPCLRHLKQKDLILEDTHLSDIDRINKLVAVVSIAFTWAYKAGIYLHQHIKPIVIKKHTIKAHSFFKYGLRFIANALLVRFDQLLTLIKVLSCT